MYSNDSKKDFLISTISDEPDQVFHHLSIIESSLAKGIHFDMMDGVFVPRLGLYPELLSTIRKRFSLFIEVHVMLTNPSRYISQIADCGADRIVFHIEANESMEVLLERSKEVGLKSGVAINPESDISLVRQHLPMIDSIMLMAIHPGTARQPILDSTFLRVQELRDLIRREDRDIEVVIDGGVTFSNAKQLFDLGANTLVCGSATAFQKENSFESNLHQLESLLKN